MKTCKLNNCINPVFGGGFCKWHQNKREDKKIKKLASHSQKSHIQDFSFGFSSQLDLFWHLWENSQDIKGCVKCPFTDKILKKYNIDYLSHFAHILPKKNYPHFKLNPDNICIVFPEFHKITDQGTTKDREAHPDWKWDLWDARVIAMKQEYIAFKHKNLLA